MPAEFLLDTGVLDTDLLGPVVIVTASADLGTLDSSSNSLVIHNVTATGELGSLSANARAADTIEAIANAALGELTANADTQPLTPTTTVGVSGGSPNYVQPNFVKPAPIQEIQVATVLANASASFGLINSQAMAEITFSILEDDAEVLLLI
jgi:hypothetical protein